jgi:hypothetical protein
MEERIKAQVEIKRTVELSLTPEDWAMDEFEDPAEIKRQELAVHILNERIQNLIMNDMRDDDCYDVCVDVVTELQFAKYWTDISEGIRVLRCVFHACERHRH